MHFRLLLIALAFTLMACGGSSESTSDSAAQPETAAAETSAPAPSESSSPSPSSDDPCALLTAEEIATALGADASEVQAGTPSDYNDEITKECSWEIVHNGLEDTVNVWMRFRKDGRYPDGLPALINGWIADGETFQNRTLEHEAAELGGVSGSLTTVSDSPFVKSRIYSFHVNDEVLYRVTLGRSLGDGDEALPSIPDEAFAQLASAIVQ